MAILNDCFRDLDEDGSQAIGVDELEDPLIALGLVDTREQVEEMVSSIDDDMNIEFEEFLKLVKGGAKTQKKMMAHANEDANNDQDIIFNFFQKLTSGELQPNKDMKVGFGIYYSQERRKKILDAIFDVRDPERNQQGKKILENYRTQLGDQMKRIKQNRKEMAEQGLRPEPDEAHMFEFMNKRAEAFERNELDPERMRDIIGTLGRNRWDIRWPQIRASQELGPFLVKLKQRRFGLY